MACCAFAVCLLTQLLWPLRWLRDRLFGAMALTDSAAVAWSPNMPRPAPPATASRWKPALLLLFIAEIAGLGVAASAASLTTPPASQPSTQFLEALHKSLCSAAVEEPK